MERFWDLLERSVIIQGMLTLLFAATVCALVLMSRPISGELWGALGVILGFWFGSKVQNEVHAAAKREQERREEQY